MLFVETFIWGVDLELGDVCWLGIGAGRFGGVLLPLNALDVKDVFDGFTDMFWNIEARLFWLFGIAGGGREGLLLFFIKFS